MAKDRKNKTRLVNWQKLEKWRSAASDKFFLKWWFSGATACLGAFAGLLGSLYADRLKEAVPIALVVEGVWWIDGPICWPAVWFWSSLLLFGLFFGLGFNAQNQATYKLESLIRTLPPRNLLVDFEDLFRAAFTVASIAQEEENVDWLRESIINALSAVAVLGKAFDGRGDHPQYSVNIMLYRRMSEIAPGDLKQHIRFAEPGYNPDAWDGVLQLQTDFAYTWVDKARSADGGVLPILLPVPKPEQRVDNGKSTVLPGAPEVYCDPKKFKGYENALQLATWCREHSGLRPSVAEEIERYFTDGAGKAIRSFVCIPIVLPSTNERDSPTVLGVLNVHSDRDGFLLGEKAALFVPLAAPFTLLIARSLAKYVKLKSGS